MGKDFFVHAYIKLADKKEKTFPQLMFLIPKDSINVIVPHLGTTFLFNGCCYDH